MLFQYYLKGISLSLTVIKFGILNNLNSIQYEKLRQVLLNITEEF